jgi:hypothetical protein
LTLLQQQQAQSTQLSAPAAQWQAAEKQTPQRLTRQAPCWHCCCLQQQLLLLLLLLLSSLTLCTAIWIFGAVRALRTA